MPTTTEPEMEKKKNSYDNSNGTTSISFLFFIIHSDFKFPTAQILEPSYAKLVS